jgi:hypothetical protein
MVIAHEVQVFTKAALRKYDIRKIEFARAEFVNGIFDVVVSSAGRQKFTTL